MVHIFGQGKGEEGVGKSVFICGSQCTCCMYRHQIGRTEIRNVDVQCTSASSEVKLDRQSFLHLTSGFFFGYLPCPSSDCPMHAKKKKLKAHQRHTRHLVIPTSPPRSLEKSSEERASFGPAQLGSQSALVKIHDFRSRNRNLS